MSSGNIIDRRSSKNKSAVNRKAFIDRYRDVLKEHVERLANSKNRSITDAAQKRDITINRKTLDEPSYQYDREDSQSDRVLPGNDRFANGDIIPIPKQGGKGTGAGQGGGDESVDEFTFTLTEEEFYDILFHNCALPDFIKNGIKTVEFSHMQRAGYTKEGSPCQLDLKKTFENAIARRIATRTEEKEPAYLDEIDLRYKHFQEVSKPSRHAVMFCLLDVSGSMTEELKMWAKKYFLLLYLFLKREYNNVEVVFIRHHDTAREVTEKEFFYDKDSGGTTISSALRLTADIMKERYSVEETNMYIAQCSDGDNWGDDDSVALAILEDELLPNLQYYAYLEVARPSMWMGKGSTWHDFLKQTVVPHHKNAQAKRITHESEIFHVFSELFKKK